MTLEELEQGRVLPIDKPYGWSSFQVVNKLKWQIKRELGVKKFKIGHAGTLDPLASGMLLVCVGKATKRIDELQAGTKVYTATIVLGATTPCFDMERSVNEYAPTSHIDLQKLEEVRQQFVGEIDQVPPMFSAVRVAGERAYSYARDGKPAEIAPKKVKVYDFEITAVRNLGNPDLEELFHRYSSSLAEGQSADEPQQQEQQTELYRNPQGHIPEGLPQVDFRIRCGKGTYIRSIARDFGLALDSVAFLASLRREQVGEYTVDRAIAVESGADAAI